MLDGARMASLLKPISPYKVLDVVGKDFGLTLDVLKDVEQDSGDALLAREVAAALMGDKKVIPHLREDDIQVYVPLAKNAIRRAIERAQLSSTSDPFVGRVEKVRNTLLPPEKASKRATQGASASPVTVDAIIREAAAEFAVSVDSLFGTGKSHVPRPARDIAIHLIFRLLRSKQSDIANLFKVTDNSIHQTKEKVRRIFEDKKNPLIARAENVCRKLGVDPWVRPAQAPKPLPLPPNRERGALETPSQDDILQAVADEFGNDRSALFRPQHKGQSAADRQIAIVLLTRLRGMSSAKLVSFFKLNNTDAVSEARFRIDKVLKDKDHPVGARFFGVCARLGLDANRLCF